MRLDSILGNSQRLDGGSMFGNCPRAVWERWSPPDQQHRISLACRSLLVREADGRHILFETGIGAFFPPKLRERYGVQEANHVLLENLKGIGVAAEQIDIIVLSHLHFDHAGGLLEPWSEGGKAKLAFPNAKYVIGKQAWERAQNPHPRDRASFIPELNELLMQSQAVELLESSTSTLLGEQYSFSFSDGHTPGLTLGRIESPKGPVTFMGDLIPGTPWIHLPITMGYDRFPERLIEEKEEMLNRLIAENGWAFLTHDPKTAACRISRDEKGRYRPTEEIVDLNWSA